MRPVSGPSSVEIVKTITAPGLFVELQFASGTVRLCSFGATDWNGHSWIGANFQIDGLDGDGKTARVSLWDPNAAFRTLAVSGGIRNRPIKMWQAQFPALGAGDPNMIFSGAGDGVRWAQGRTDIDCARRGSAVLMAPRMRISPATGFHFLAPPGSTFQWGNVVVTLQPAQR